MSRATMGLFIGVIAASFAVMADGHATTVKHFDLSKMTASAARVFRGTVTDIQPGTVTVGGGTIPTTTYRIKVVESFKGKFATMKGVSYAEVTMIGSVKSTPDKNGIRHFPIFEDMPKLQRGRDYLLFLTAESKVSLSSPVGLQQGCFDIDTSAPEQPTANGLANRGLAPGVKGALPYNDLAARVRAEVAAQKGGR